MEGKGWWTLAAVTALFGMAACGGGPTGPRAPEPSPPEPAAPTDSAPLVQQPAPPAAPSHEPPASPPQAEGAHGEAIAPAQALASVGAPLAVYTDPGDLPYLRLATDPEQQLPLEHTHVKAALTGFVAEVEVSQTYENPHAQPIEAVYTFPLPENSAVNHMRMVIGTRVINAQIEERKKARRIYQRAKQQGHTAALLEQERPNVFTQSVANIEPGKKIDVVIRYVQDLSYDAGQYEFVFPMVVGPRFMPGGKRAGPQSGSGTHADTEAVPDASRISPPYVGRGQRSGHDISLELVADASLAVSDFSVPTHEVVARKPADGTLRLSLAEKDSLPNRDFVLRYRVAGAEPKATLFTSEAGKRGRFFSLVIHPPALDVDGLVGRRELIFVVDVSGSMSGTPLGMCRSAMREAIRGLRPVDTFNILTFAGGTQAAFARPRPANSANIRRALGVVDSMRAGGGTYMADAVKAALSTEVAPGRHRYVFFMTDGYVGNEKEIIVASDRFVSALRARGQRARVFGFGVGSSVNRHLIDGLSKAGQGIAVYASAREDPARAVNRFYHYIDRAVLTDLSVDWAGLGVSELYPAAIPDLFASHPVIVHGRFGGAPSSAVSVRARAGERSLHIPVAVRPARAQGDAYKVQGALWARAKVDGLEELLWDGHSPAVQRDITRLGLDFDMVTRFTSFVAVDRSRRVGTGDPTTVVQPVEAPEGVDVEMAGGVRAERPTASWGMDQADGYGYEFADDPLAAGGFGPTGAAMPADPGAEDEAEEEEIVLEQMAEGYDAAPAMEVDGRRGCGCKTAGGADDRAARWAWLVAMAALALVGARRARRRAVGRPRRPRRAEGSTAAKERRKAPPDEVGWGS